MSNQMEYKSTGTLQIQTGSVIKLVWETALDFLFVTVVDSLWAYSMNITGRCLLSEVYLIYSTNIPRTVDNDQRSFRKCLTGRMRNVHGYWRQNLFENVRMQTGN